jgi:hypothetical protein
MTLNSQGSPDFKGITQTSDNAEGITNKSALTQSDQDCAAAGTADQFTAGVIPNGITLLLKAKTTNTDKVFIGKSEDIAEGKEALGAYPLAPGEVYTLKISNLDLLWIDSVVNGEGVTITYEDDA